MSETAGNQTVSIVTNKTPHVTTPHGIASSGGVQGGPSKTTVADEKVFTQGGTLQNGGTATPVSWSSDVRMEGQYVCRTGDKTQQVKPGVPPAVGPTAGGVVDPNAKAQNPVDGNHCTVAELRGKCLPGTGEADHGRSLGLPRGTADKGGNKSNEKNYLEVLSGDALEFEISWKDTLTPERQAQCQYGEHPHWQVWSFYEDDRKEKEYTGVTKITVPADMTTFDGLTGPALSTKGAAKADSVSTVINAAKVMAFMWYVHWNPGFLNVFVDGCAGHLHANIKIKPTRAIKIQFDFEFLGTLLRRYLYKPLEIIARFASLIGVNIPIPDEKNTQFRSGSTQNEKGTNVHYGDEPVEPKRPSKAARKSTRARHQRTVAAYDQYEADKAEFDSKKKKLSPIKIGQVEIEYDLCFMHMPRLIFAHKFKELTLEKNGHTPVEVNRNWELSIEWDKFLYIDLYMSIPITTFATLLGGFISWALSKLDVEARVGLYLTLSLDPGARIAYNEYEEVTDVDGYIQLDFDFGLRFRLQVGKNNTFVLQGGFFIRVEANNFGGKPEKNILLGADVNGSLSFHVDGSYDVSFLGYSRSDSFNWYPAWGKYEIQPKWWPFVKVN